MFIVLENLPKIAADKIMYSPKHRQMTTWQTVNYKVGSSLIKIQPKLFLKVHILNLELIGFVNKYKAIGFVIMLNNYDKYYFLTF